MPTPLRRALLAAAALVLLAPAAAPAQTTRDFASTALNIIPSGQQGSVPVPAGADRQARMYDALTPKFDDVTSADLHRDFKSERFGTSGQCPCRTERVPRDGVRVVRDRFDVPHITAKTVDALTFTAGWISAGGRALFLEQARFDARVAAVDAPHLSAIALIAGPRGFVPSAQTESEIAKQKAGIPPTGRPGRRAPPPIAGLRSFVPSAQTESEIAKQTAVIRRTGRRGRRLLHDIDVYISGINAQLRSVNSPSRPWTRNDIYALNALKDQFFGEGGGDEARRSMFLAGLQQRLGPQSGQLVFDDLRQRDPADTPVSIGGTFPYAQVPGSKTGNMVVDPNTLQLWRYGPAGGTSAPGTTLRGAAASLPAAAPTDAAPHASNVLMLSGARSRNGHP